MCHFSWAIFRNFGGNAALWFAFYWESGSILAPLTCKYSLSIFNNLHDFLLQLPSNSYSLQCSFKKPCRDRHSGVTTKIAVITVMINILKHVKVPTQGDVKT